MVHKTFLSTSSRVSLALVASFALTLTACGGDAEQEAVTIDEATPDPLETEVVETGALADPVAGDAVAVDTPDPVADVDASAPGGGWESLQADWTSSVPIVQARFGELSEEELLATGGDRDQLVVLVQQKYDLDPATAEQQVSDFETMR